MNADSFFEKQGRLFWGILGLGLVILLGVIDYLTGLKSIYCFSILSRLPCWHGMQADNLAFLPRQSVPSPRSLLIMKAD